MDTKPVEPKDEAGVDQTTCPICRQPNQCAYAAKLPDANECWCMRESFPDRVLNSVPAEYTGRTCICKSCLQAINAETSPQLPGSTPCCP
ncbi:cysteine-rich CWC family protein [Paenibacillus sp. FSL W8-0919]|uniref:cysteine-rich CWC family protein n=1 Tax=Paenibacillus sp. FSL W8-0919 TaxID=2954707 RepID=UPI0030FCA237